jgi:hypothetical protein
VKCLSAYCCSVNKYESLILKMVQISYTRLYGFQLTYVIRRFVFVFCVGPAVTHRMYCSLPRLIVLTPLSVSLFHFLPRSTSDDGRDLYQRKVELWARNIRSI